MYNHSFEDRIKNSPILWEIHFKPYEPDIAKSFSPQNKPEIDIYVAPNSKNAQFTFTASELVEIQALDYLGRIKKLCDKLQKEVQTQTTSNEKYLKNTTIINKAMDNLSDVIKKFNSILKKFKFPEKNDKNQKEEL